MKNVLIAVLGAVICLCGCATKKVSTQQTDYAKLVSELREMTARYEREMRVYKDSLLMVKGLNEKSSNVADSASHLETSYATSDAAIRGGKLYHSIENRDSVPGKVQYVYVNVEKRDTVWKEKTDTCYIERKKDVQTVKEKKRFGDVFFYASGWVAWIVLITGAGIWFRYKIKKGER